MVKVFHLCGSSVRASICMIPRGWWSLHHDIDSVRVLANDPMERAWPSNALVNREFYAPIPWACISSDKKHQCIPRYKVRIFPNLRLLVVYVVKVDVTSTLIWVYTRGRLSSSLFSPRFGANLRVATQKGQWGMSWLCNLCHRRRKGRTKWL